MKRWLPLVALLLVLVLAWGLGLHRQLSWSALAANQAVLADFVARRAVLAAFAFVGTYIAAVALSFPGAVVLTLAGGLLFGTMLGAALAVLGATGGAVLVFLAARHALADMLAHKFGVLTAQIKPRLERNGFFYLLALRLIPVFPFWLVNLAPALAGMRLAPFALATFIGIIPATVVFASIGAGLGTVLEAGREPDLSLVLSPPVLLPLAGLAALALAPVAWRGWRRIP